MEMHCYVYITLISCIRNKKVYYYLDYYYLENRSQYVQFNGMKSGLQNVTCRVPQGSILGPKLFLLYINDICNVSNILDFILYADDTNVFYKHENIDDV